MGGGQGGQGGYGGGQMGMGGGQGGQGGYGGGQMGMGGGQGMLEQQAPEREFGQEGGIQDLIKIAKIGSTMTPVSSTSTVSEAASNAASEAASNVVSEAALDTLRNSAEPAVDATNSIAIPLALNNNPKRAQVAVSSHNRNTATDQDNLSAATDQDNLSAATDQKATLKSDPQIAIPLGDLQAVAIADSDANADVKAGTNDVVNADTEQQETRKSDLLGDGQNYISHAAAKKVLADTVTDTFTDTVTDKDTDTVTDKDTDTVTDTVSDTGSTQGETHLGEVLTRNSISSALFGAANKFRNLRTLF